MSLNASLLLLRLANRRAGYCRTHPLIRHLDGGFSLLEMVVVLAIIGILVAIQLPNVIGNTDKAKLVAAQSRIANAITECATAKVDGATERQLTYANNSGDRQFIDLVPSMASAPTGYKWDGLETSSAGRGCSYMYLMPVDSDGIDASSQGFPRLYAKIAPGGRIIKVADFCRPVGSLRFLDECKAWDSTLDAAGRTGRDLRDPNWARKTE